MSDGPATKLPRLVLASGSPRRRELLRLLGLEFTVRPVDLDESVLPGETAAEHVMRLANAKAGARGEDGEWVLAADTVVVLDGEILGKPRDAADARRMLRSIAGREHQVFTGVAVSDPARGECVSELTRTRVRMAELTDAEIAWYVDTGEPMDKAGSYAVQGLGAMFVEELEGNYSNVVGLPIPTTVRLFRRLGLELRSFGDATRADDRSTPAARRG